MVAYQLIKKEFQQLSIVELYEILKIRMEVFVVEQACPYQDLDDIDQKSYHVWYGHDGKVVAYIRVVPPGILHDNYCAIGRVVTSKRARGSGFGKEIFKVGMQICAEKFPGVAIQISAQLYLKRFYESFGFNVCDKIYLEDGIPHIRMSYKNEGTVSLQEQVLAD